MKINSVCVYCGISSGILPDYVAAATQFGRLLALRNITLVYGGGNVGLMGALADGALKAGGKVIGVMPQRLIEREAAHNGLTEFYSVSSMHERKMKMADLSDAFVALPGGIGTIEEIFEVYTWTQMGIQRKPCALLNVSGYYSRLISFLEFMADQNFVKDKNYRNLLIDSDGEKLIDRIALYEHDEIDRWKERKREA